MENAFARKKAKAKNASVHNSWAAFQSWFVVYIYIRTTFISIQIVCVSVRRLKIFLSLKIETVKILCIISPTGHFGAVYVQCIHTTFLHCFFFVLCCVYEIEKKILSLSVLWFCLWYSQKSIFTHEIFPILNFDWIFFLKFQGRYRK